jgi:AraC-like DNA-binding protein
MSFRIHLLEDGNLTEIALSWDFNSSSHFSRSFEIRYGLTSFEFGRRVAG